MIIELIVNCPECEEEIRISTMDLTSDKPQVHITSFEQSMWECENCNKEFAIGDIDLIEI